MSTIKIPCIHCHKEFTPQGLKMHEQRCLSNPVNCTSTIPTLTSAEPVLTSAEPALKNPVLSTEKVSADPALSAEEVSAEPALSAEEPSTGESWIERSYIWIAGAVLFIIVVLYIIWNIVPTQSVPKTISQEPKVDESFAWGN